MADPPEVTAVGSAAWTGGVEYGGEYTERINQFIREVDHGGLLSYASSLREGRPCTVSEKFSVGNFNLVRKIEFDDGMAWIARLRMPPLPDERHQEESVRLDMQSELDTMAFIRKRTKIPTPRVYGYNLDHQNAVGCPFSIIEYIHGNTAEEVSQGYPGNHEGIPPEFRERFWRQVASIMMQLASIRLPKIGSIIRDAPGSFIVGPIVETRTGPYNSAAEFYADYPLALAKSFGEKHVGGQDELIQAFRSLASSFTSSSSVEGFGLANFDLNPNNILVDRDFNVLAVIDWDSVVAVPDAALYCFPFPDGRQLRCPGGSR